MLQIAANARLATRLAAAGMPPILDDGWPDTERPVLIHTPRGLVAFAVSTAGPACVTGLRYAETVIPLIALPPVVLDVEPSQTVDIALLALLVARFQVWAAWLLGLGVIGQLAMHRALLQGGAGSDYVRRIAPYVLLGMVATGDLFNFFVFLEISSLAGAAR